MNDNNSNFNAGDGSRTSASSGQHYQLHHQNSGGPSQTQGVFANKETKSFNEKLRAFFKFGKGPAASGSGAVGGAGGYYGVSTAPKLYPEYSSGPVLLTPELSTELTGTQPVAVRVKALHVISDSCQSKRIEPNTVEKLWTLTNDLFSSPDMSTRHAVFSAFTTIIQAQFEKPGYFRAKVFSFLKSHDKTEDIYHMFHLLVSLTENGRNLAYIEEKVGPFLLQWMVFGEVIGPTTVSVGVEEFMGLLTNVVKFNCSFLDDDVLAGIIQHTCITAITRSHAPDAIACINILNTIVMYSMIPPSTLQSVIATLCRTVNVDVLCVPSWKVMRNLLGTHLGYSGLYTLINFMNVDAQITPRPQSSSTSTSPSNTDPILLLTNSGQSASASTQNSELEMNSIVRGAVFFTGLVLWGGSNRVVRSLTRGASAGGGGGGIIGVVLGAYEVALARNHPLITYEVLLRVQDLIRHSADSLQVIGWGLVLSIMRKVIDFFKQQEYQASAISSANNVNATANANISTSGQSNEKNFHLLIRNNQQFLSQIHETLDMIENILPTKTFCADSNTYWEQVVEPICHTRPVTSIENLLKHKHIKLLNSSTPSFLPNLVQFTLIHFQKETRVSLRLQALALIKKICLMNQDTLEEALLDNVILPNLKNIESELDQNVRQHCVQFLVDFLMESRSKKGHDLLHYVEKVVNRPFELEKSAEGPTYYYVESEVQDILVGVSGIIRIFQRKIYSLPSSISVTAFKILVRHLEKHYKAKNNCLEKCSLIRYKIFECFFRIRANALYHLGFPNENDIIEAYSSYLAVDHRDSREGPPEHVEYHLGGVSPPIPSSSQDTKPGGPALVSYISLTAACKQVISCLKKEKDWRILELVLLQLPHVMENKALILSKHGNDVDVLAASLCFMVTDKSYFGTGDTTILRNTPPRFSRSDFQAFVFPALTSLVSYHSSLDTKIQQQIVKCLEFGLVSKCSRICISALTTCTLEMKEVMHKLIPEILLSLSKISPKSNIAIPVLEFLSTLIHLPRVFASFVQDQYMSIFAICLPYTNPFKFNHYVVSLAHHVIALWFLKCRLSFRKGFVSYIIKGLESNVWAPYVEATNEKYALVNEDSSNRKRSNSLNDQSNRRRERMISGQSSVHGLSRQSSYQPVDSNTIQFHQELTETCVDLMARYAFADCSPLPSKFESAGFLTQHGGNTMSWMIDNRIITISTSGCSQKELREGLCDRCWMMCKQNQTSAKRSLLVGQHSYDEQEGREGIGGVGVKRSNTISGSGGSGQYSSGSERRRHKSAMVHQQSQDVMIDKTRQHHDDLHLEHKLEPRPQELGRSRDGSGRKEGNGAQICMCWCQGWAEILIRRPTGNTSWMMRVQNIIGGSVTGWTYGASSGDKLVSNLCALYLNDIVENAKTELHGGYCGDDESAKVPEKMRKCSLEELELSQEENKDAKNHALQDGAKTLEKSDDHNNKSNGDGNRSPPIGRESPDSKKTPVKRSNSSPEMAKGPPGESQDEMDGQKQSSYLPSCGPIPEEKERKSESESESVVVKPLMTSSTSSSSSPPHTPQGQSSQSQGSFQSQDSLHTLQLTPLKRDRMFTISVMTPARRNTAQSSVRRIMSVGSGDISSRTGLGGGIDPGIRSGISPSFIFLQLCGQGIFGSHSASKPLLLPSTESTTNSLKVLDYITPYETHKIGVLYIGPGQARDEPAILQNSHGSLRYRDFLQGLGSLIKLSEADPQRTFLGGLDGKGKEDGEFACIWRDDVMQVIFHVATLMPTRLTTDPNCNGKKRHIGNDFVAIVYNNSDEEFDIATIKCQFLYACVIIQPLDHRTNRVYVKAKPSLAENIGHTDVKIVSDQNLPIMARQLALHSNLASVIYRKISQNSEPYASNWLERLRAIKRLRARLFPDSVGTHGGPAGGLSHSAQELNESLAAGGGGGTAAAPSGSTGNIVGGVGSMPKRNSFIVDDFTEYV